MHAQLDLMAITSAALMKLTSSFMANLDACTGKAWVMSFALELNINSVFSTPKSHKIVINKNNKTFYMIKHRHPPDPGQMFDMCDVG